MGLTWKVLWSPLGILHDLPNANSINTILDGFLSRSCSTTWSPNLSLSIGLQNDLTNEDRVRLRLDELNSLEERRLEAQQNLEVYKEWMTWAYNKMVHI